MGKKNRFIQKIADSIPPVLGDSPYKQLERDLYYQEVIGFLMFMASIFVPTGIFMLFLNIATVAIALTAFAITVAIFLSLLWIWMSRQGGE